MKELITQLFIDHIQTDGKGSGPFYDLAQNKKEAVVPFTMPGDLVEVLVHRKKKDKYTGQFLHLIEPSSERIEPRCPHFAHCGGCLWQHIPYAQQLKIKESTVQSLFKELNISSELFRSILGAQDPWFYRNKMEFSFSQDKKGEKYLGLFIHSSRGKVFNLDSCFIAPIWFSEALAKVRTWWKSTPLQAYNPNKNSGTLRTLTVREGTTTTQKLVMLTVSGNPEDAIHQKELDGFKDLFDPSISLYLRIHQAIKGQTTQFFEMHLKGPEIIEEKISIDFDRQPYTFTISPSAFFQPNTKQAIQLYKKALELAELKPNDIVYDLYCGTGTLGVLTAPYVKTVIGMELSEESSLDGRTNAKLNQLDNVEIITGDVGLLLATRTDLPRPTLILLDPPRVGLNEKALEHILSLKAERIVYISCNPTSQVRDLKVLLENGYSINQIQPVDQFPHTAHIENITSLKLTCLNS